MGTTSHLPYEIYMQRRWQKLHVYNQFTKATFFQWLLSEFHSLNNFCNFSISQNVAEDTETVTAQIQI